MLSFCPTCGNVLFILDTSGTLKLECSRCPFVHVIKSVLRSRFYCKLKEIDDVVGEKEAWKNVDFTEERCPKCSHPKAYFMQIQTRSADEPMTTMYRCCNHECSHNWRD